MPRIPFRRRRTLKERIAHKLHETTEQLSEQTSQLASSLTEKAEHAADKASHAGSQAAGKASHSKRAFSKKAAHQREHLMEQGSYVMSDLNSQAAARAKKISEHSPDVDTEKLMKEAREVANNAAAVALEFWEKTRSRTGSAANSVPSREQISQQLGIAAQTIEQKSRDAQDAARKSADAAKKSADAAKKKGADAAKKSAADMKVKVKHIEPAVEEKLVFAKARTGEKIGAAKEKTGAIAEDTADAGKNFGALLFWLAAAAGIIYFIILDKERRDKVWNTTKAAGSEIYEVAREVRGQDGEFV